MIRKTFSSIIIFLVCFLFQSSNTPLFTAQYFQVTSNPFHFGEVRSNATKITKTLYIRNISNKNLDLEMSFKTMPGSMGDGYILWLEEKKDTSFSLSPGETESFVFAINPSLVTIWKNPEHFGDISIIATNAYDYEIITVTANIIQKAPELIFSDDLIDFSEVKIGENPKKQIQVKNNGEEMLYGSIEADSEWIKISHNNFQLNPNEVLYLGISIDTSFLEQGDNEGKINISSNGGEGEILVKAFLLSSPPNLSVSTLSISLGKVNPDDQPEDSFTITNTGQSTLEGEIDSEEEWISLSEDAFELEEEESLDVTVTIDPSYLSPGKHTGWIDIVSNGGEETIKVTLEIEEQPPSLLLNSKLLDFQSVSLGAVVQKQILVKNAGGKTLTGSLQTNSTFLSISPERFSLTEGETETITVSLDTDQCSPGMNAGHILCTSNGGEEKISVQAIREPIRIELIIGKDLATVNGNLYPLPYPPIIENGRTLVPLRFLAESIKLSVEWDSTTSEITLKSSRKTILLKINSRIAYLFEAGKKTDVLLDVAPAIRKSTTIIPLRFVSENMDAKVEYEAKTQKIIVER